MTASPAAPAASRQANIAAALLVLKSMGLSPADLTAARSGRPPVPAFAGYVPVVAATVTPGTLRAYGSYWKRAVEQWGGRRLDEPAPSEVRQLAAYVRANAVPRRNGRGGRSAGEDLISALRCPYRRAVDDGLIDEKDNPARKVAKPRRLPSARRALAGARLAEINQVAAVTGDDPEPGQGAAVGRHPAGQHALDPAYHADVGGAQLRVRGRPRLRRPHRRQGGVGQRHVDLRARATLAEVAAALSALAGEPHPLALPGGGRYDSAG